MLNEILIWWWQQMCGLLGGGWLDRTEDCAGALVVEPVSADSRGDNIVALRFRRHGHDQALGRFALNAADLAAIRPIFKRFRQQRCILLLPPERLLERTVSLPLAAERDWRRIMTFEMDRLTPFAANEVYWAGAITRRDRASGRIELLLSLVPRAPLGPLLGAMAQAGLRPHVLQATAEGGSKRVIALERTASARAPWEQQAAVVTAGLCAALVLVALALPVVRLEWAWRRVEQRISALRPDVDQAETVRRALVARIAGSDVNAARRMQSSDPLAVLSAVTEALPDDTFLMEFTLEHDRLSLSGQSAAAARLLSALAANSSLRNPVFSAPVTRNEAAHIDLFSIRAEIGP